MFSQCHDPPSHSCSSPSYFINIVGMHLNSSFNFIFAALYILKGSQTKDGSKDLTGFLLWNQPTTTIQNTTHGLTSVLPLCYAVMKHACTYVNRQVFCPITFLCWRKALREALSRPHLLYADTYRTPSERRWIGPSCFPISFFTWGDVPKSTVLSPGSSLTLICRM